MRRWSIVILLAILLGWIAHRSTVQPGVRWNLQVPAGKRPLASVVMPLGWHPRQLVPATEERTRFVFTPAVGQYPYVVVSLAKGWPQANSPAAADVRWESRDTAQTKRLSASVGSDGVVFDFFAQRAQTPHLEATARQIVASLQAGPAATHERAPEVRNAEALAFRLPADGKWIGTVALLAFALLLAVEAVLRGGDERRRIREAEESKRQRAAEEAEVAATLNEACPDKCRPPKVKAMDKESALLALRALHHRSPENT